MLTPEQHRTHFALYKRVEKLRADISKAADKLGGVAWSTETEVEREAFTKAKKCASDLRFALLDTYSASEITNRHYKPRK